MSESGNFSGRNSFRNPYAWYMFQCLPYLFLLVLGSFIFLILQNLTSWNMFVCPCFHPRASERFIRDKQQLPSPIGKKRKKRDPFSAAHRVIGFTGSPYDPVYVKLNYIGCKMRIVNTSIPSVQEISFPDQSWHERRLLQCLETTNNPCLQLLAGEICSLYDCELMVAGDLSHS